MNISYTDMARAKRPRLAGIGCACENLGDLSTAAPSAQELTRWMSSLSPMVRQTFQRSMTEIVNELPQAAIEKLSPGTGLGLGEGLAMVFSNILSTAATIAVAHDTNSTNQSISHAASKAEAAIAAANAAMSGQVNTSVSEAQIQANLVASQTGQKTTILITVILGAVGLGGLALYLRSTRKK